MDEGLEYVGMGSGNRDKVVGVPIARGRGSLENGIHWSKDRKGVGRVG